MPDRVHMTATAPAVRPSRATVLAISIALPITALCATAGGLVWPVETGWADWAETAVMTGPTLAVAALLAAMIRLLVMDWWAEIRSHEDWAAIAVEVTTATLAEHRDQGGHLYQPTVCDEAVHAVLRAYRHAVPRQWVERAADIGNTHDRDETGLSHSTGLRESSEAVSIGPPLSDSNDVGGELAEALDPSTIGTDASVMRQGWRAVHALAPVTSASRSKCHVRRALRFATPVRRIVNAGAGYTWNGSGSRLRAAGIPIKIVADIVVLGQNQNRSDGSNPSPGAPGAQFNGGPSIRAGPSTSTAGSTPRSRTRQQPNRNSSPDPTALVETQAQVLPRQAAREDDAAEQLEERSLSPPDVAVSRRPELRSVASLPPLDPAIVQFVESLAVADFWRDHAAAQAQDDGRRLSNDTGGNLRTLLDRSSERALDRGSDSALPGSRPAARRRCRRDLP
jgi:hypothetical protein